MTRPVLRAFTLFVFLSLVFSACNLRSGLPFLATLTPTASTTPTGTPIPTGTPSPTATPIPTLAPIVRIEAAEQALFYGDYEAALREFTITLETAPPLEVESAARLGIARAHWLLGQPQEALNDLQFLINNYPQAPNLAEAWFFIGEISSELGRYDEAADAYAQYLALRPGILDAFVLERRGDALLAGGHAFDAVDAYTIALNSPRLAGGEEALKIKIGDALALAGDASTALALYSELYATSPNDYTKATLILKRADMLNILGEPETAFSLYEESIANYPLSNDAYIALLRLLDGGREVNELDRGLVDYFAGEYSLAVFAFDRYLTTAPAEHDGTAHYYKGLALRAIDSYDDAIAEWSELIQTHPSSDDYWDDAWEEIADTQWAFLGDPAAGIATYLSFAARVPDHARAAEFLFYAAQIAERNGDLEAAALTWERVDNEYPGDAQAGRARFLAGITRYRLGDYAGALANFQIILPKTGAPLESAQALFWTGKAYLALGDAAAADTAFAQAAVADPTGYYSERAGDFLFDRDPFEPPQSFDLAVDWEAERALAEGWLRVNFSLPDDVDLSSPAPLQGDARFLRGTALWNLGFPEEARAEFESLRLDIQPDPANNYRLANYLLDLGLYRTAIFCTRQILTLAGMDDAATLNAPPWFSHVRFGTYYSGLILPEAEAAGFHPLFVYGLVRQESLFEGFVRSTAGARGLMQIIPETGQSIADNMGWPPSYTAADLYRPLVSITLGVEYLASQRNYFAQAEPVEAIALYAALAAYNGGPGNANAWLLQAGGDPDLFLEIIRFEETRQYVRGVYELFVIYREVWGQ